MAKNSFGKASRLLGPSQYSSIFKKADYKLSSPTLLILGTKSAISPRLGVIIAKKNIKGAVQRNRLKRIIRESFRLRQQDFDTIDMVVLVRPGLDKANNHDVFVQLNRLFDELINKLNRNK
jgi:ribonuclease P protein component